MDEATSGTGTANGVVLVATDFSAPADEALRRAHARAAAQNGKLIVCHVMPTMLGANVLFPQRSVQQGNAQLELQTRATELLVERTRMLTGREPSQFEQVVVEGTPYSAIVEQAEQAGAELIVIGDQGVRGLGRLGSVAERVVRFAHCPVLVARTGERARRILVATDLSDPSLPALAAAARESKRGGEQLTALYCIENTVPVVGPEYGVAFTPVLPANYIEQARETAHARLEGAVQRVGLPAEVRVTEGPPADAILAVAEELDADLIVIATRGRTGLRRVVLGSVAESVVRNAKASVLVVRLHERG